MSLHQDSLTLVQKWGMCLEGIEDPYVAKVTAQLLENQAKNLINEANKLDEDNSAYTTTVGRLGTFQKFAFPLVRRVYPELIFNKIGATQPMNGPTSQIFYLGHGRGQGGTYQQIYSKYDLTYRSMITSSIGNVGVDATGTVDWNDGVNTSPNGLDLDEGNFDLSNVFNGTHGSPSTTFGGQIAAWPNATTILGYSTSAGEDLAGTGFPELTFNIEQQPVVARTRKMRALWTLEASQDLRALHDLDLEQELTDLLSKELQLEIDRELIEDIRHIAYDPNAAASIGGWYRGALDWPNSNNFQDNGEIGQDGATYTPEQFLYDFTATTNPSGTNRNVWAIDFTSTALPFAPQHVGHVYANLLGIVNFASQDIYKTTHRGPGSWIITSPIVGAMLESAAKLEGGIPSEMQPTNMQANSISYKGKFMNKYDLFIDPLYPEDEILMGYKGTGPMDSGFVYCPYIPIQQLPTITDPETFQPRKGILTRYGKAAITPESRFYRVIRIVGPAANYLYTPFGRSTANNVIR